MALSRRDSAIRRLGNAFPPRTRDRGDFRRMEPKVAGPRPHNGYVPPGDLSLSRNDSTGLRGQRRTDGLRGGKFAGGEQLFGFGERGVVAHGGEQLACLG
jgi:hypothetical protein